MTGAGHYPMLERPGEFNRLLVEIVGNLKSKGGVSSRGGRSRTALRFDRDPETARVDRAESRFPGGRRGAPEAVCLRRGEDGKPRGGEIRGFGCPTR
jgi:hypothetical protein